jgi:hypothetical protein
MSIFNLGCPSRSQEKWAPIRRCRDLTLEVNPGIVVILKTLLPEYIEKIFETMKYVNTAILNRSWWNSGVETVSVVLHECIQPPPWKKDKFQTSCHPHWRNKVGKTYEYRFIDRWKRYRSAHLKIRLGLELTLALRNSNHGQRKRLSPSLLVRR